MRVYLHLILADRIVARQGGKRMSSVGQTLKEAREARGMTLHDMQEKTKIQPRYLKAIEEDRFDVLPGHFYTRAFIRTYADHVGIDPQPLLAQLKDPEEDKLETVQEIQKIGRRADRVKEPSFSLATWFSRGLLIVFIGLVIFVIYTAAQGANLGMDMFTGKEQEPPPQMGPGTGIIDEDSSDETDEDNAENDETFEPVVTVEKMNEEGQYIYYEVSGTEEITVEIEANARVWFEAREKDSNGKVLASKVIEEGDTETFESAEGLYIRFGNTQGVILTVNDTEIDTDYKQPKNFVFQRGSDDT